MTIRSRSGHNFFGFFLNGSYMDLLRFFVFETTWRGFRHEAVSRYSWLRTESE